MRDLFTVDPVGLEGYNPKFEAFEVLFGLVERKHEVMRGLCSFDDYDSPHREPEYSYTLSIWILDKEYTISKDEVRVYGLDNFDTAVEVVNHLIKKKNRSVIEQEQVSWVLKNADDLNCDRRYWKARVHRNEIEKLKQKIIEDQERVRKAELVASLYAYEVQQRRRIDGDERKMKYVEFGGKLEDYR